MLTETGFVSCPVTSNCVTETSWQHSLTDILKITVSQRRATIVYSRENDTILNIFDLGMPQPTHYGPDDFFPFFDMAMTNETGDISGLNYVTWVSSQHSTSPYENQFVLMYFMAIPIGQFDGATFWGIYPSENKNTSGSLAVPSYRVYPLGY